MSPYEHDTCGGGGGLGGEPERGALAALPSERLSLGGSSFEGRLPVQGNAAVTVASVQLRKGKWRASDHWFSLWARNTEAHFRRRATYAADVAVLGSGSGWGEGLGSLDDSRPEGARGRGAGSGRSGQRSKHAFSVGLLVGSLDQEVGGLVFDSCVGLAVQKRRSGTCNAGAMQEEAMHSEKGKILNAFQISKFTK